jgi:hypothetical protein
LGEPDLDGGEASRIAAIHAAPRGLPSSKKSSLGSNQFFDHFRAQIEMMAAATLLRKRYQYGGHLALRPVSARAPFVRSAVK